MILVRTEAGEDLMKRAVAAGILELREADEEPAALEVMERLSRKQRERIKPFDPNANHRWPNDELLAQARAEEQAETASS